ncbi:Ig-like domain repeat protein [Streptomyces phaeolivaceus]|nr:Ig-like domain repeat protein [Streptomyces phaeolivaceus]
MSSPTAAAQTPKPRPGPEIVHTGSGPTGYSVTFRFDAPAAAKVQIFGQWLFSDAVHSTLTSSAGWTPAQWKPGAFPSYRPNQPPLWSLSDMVRGTDGTWSTTLPLPSGTFNYGFFVNCDSPVLTGCTRLQDPANPTWSGPLTYSQVYVPSDPRFGTEDLSWQAPRRKDTGKLRVITYPSPASTSPPGQHDAVVYTPPGYDPDRRTPYPTLYLSHGMGDDELAWSTQGAANRILDNLYADDKVQPMVVVMTDFNGLGGCGGSAVECYRSDVLDSVIPFVEDNFHVSDRPEDRAFAGLSAGGQRANDLLFNATEEFGYFGSWSLGGAGAPPVADSRWQNPALRTRLGLHVGGGRFDASHMSQGQAMAYQSNLEANDIPFVETTLDGVHSWDVWRRLLRTFVTEVAFKTTHTTLSLKEPTDEGKKRRTAVADVGAATGQPTPPTGHVRFYLDGVGAGHEIGTPQRVHKDGTADLSHLPRLPAGSHTVTAVYSGDDLYRASTSVAVSID